MDLLHIFALALLQGLTEFLPISSSAHLILVPILTDWQDQGLAFDVAVHVGTLTAVVYYFRRTLRALFNDWLQSLSHQQLIGESRLAWAVLLGTIPAGLVGLFLGDFIELHLRNPLVIAATTIGFGLLLAWADWQGRQQRDEQRLSLGDIIFIGMAQAVALIPGTSRSGITITAGLLLGLTREAAARFSFLLSIPIIFLAGSLKTIDLVKAGVNTDWFAIASGVIISAASAYLCIHFFLKLIEKIGMWPFVIYRLLLGAVLFGLFI